jgi:hypothetical protein
MYVLNFWHTVTDYGEWKKVFDTDPLGRQASGVRRLTIERPVGADHMVVGHLGFDSLGEAEAFGSRLQEVWKGPAGSMVSDSGLNISEVLVEQELSSQTARKVA